MERVNHFSRSPGRGRTLSRTLLSTWVLLTCIPVSWLWLSYTMSLLWPATDLFPPGTRILSSLKARWTLTCLFLVEEPAMQHQRDRRYPWPLRKNLPSPIPHRTMAFRDTGAQRTGERLFIVFHFTNTVKTNPANRIADSAGPGK